MILIVILRDFFIIFLKKFYSSRDNEDIIFEKEENILFLFLKYLELIEEKKFEVIKVIMLFENVIYFFNVDLNKGRKEISGMNFNVESIFIQEVFDMGFFDFESRL